MRVTQAIDRELDRDRLEYPVIDPKSEASRREQAVAIPLTPETVQVMRQHRLATGRPADGQLVWAQEDGRPLAAGGKLRATWQRVCKAVGIDHRDLHLHYLRHTFGTWTLASGTSLMDTAALMGHRDPSMLLRRYGHAMPEGVAASAQLRAEWRAPQRGR